MPHYFLHQRYGDESVEDYEGAGYADLEAAVADAVKTARALMAHCLQDGFVPDDWRVEIVDTLGAIRAVVPFEGTVSMDGSAAMQKEAVWYRLDLV